MLEQTSKGARSTDTAGRVLHGGCRLRLIEVGYSPHVWMISSGLAKTESPAVSVVSSSGAALNCQPTRPAKHTVSRLRRMNWDWINELLTMASRPTAR